MAGRFPLSKRRHFQDMEVRFTHMLELRLPEFDWRIVIGRRRDNGKRDLYRWDYAVVLINDEL